MRTSLILIALTCPFLAAAACGQETQATLKPRWVVAAKHVRPTAPEEATTKSRTIEILGPKCTCFGRFGDSLKERLLDQHFWIRSVTLEHGMGFDVEEGDVGFPMGAPTRITFEIDEKASDVLLFKALQDAQAYDLAAWRVQRPVPISEVLRASKNW